MTESFLQFLWLHRLFAGSLATVDGRSVSIDSPGSLNSAAGPDFLNARISIGGIRWAGSVEVHVNASDWNLHQHSNDPAYNNVILHVVYNHDCNITTAAGSLLPVLELRHFISPDLFARYDKLMRGPEKKGSVACADLLSETPDFVLHSWLERLLIERLERKSKAIAQMLEDNKGSWETTCYWLSACYFGGKDNAIPFEILAKSAPMNLISRYRDDRDRIEALLLGQAGLLNDQFSDDYPRRLQAEYEILRKGYSLTPISAYLWKFFRMRPSSFPTVRISQFASFLCTSHNLFSKLLETERVEYLLAYFNATAADYWTTHYRFDAATKASIKRVGTQLANTLVINAWLPLLFVYGRRHDRQDLCDRAVELLRQVKPESNNIVRVWKDFGIQPRSAADTQALLQLFNNYCDLHRCLDCRIGYHCLSNNPSRVNS